MKLYAFVRVLKRTPVPKKRTSEEQRQRVKGIVKKVAKGSMSLQRGCFTTETDLKQKKKRVIEYDFSLEG